MSEFEDQLKRASDLAADRARLRSPSDIRARGAQRRRRKYIANGTLGVVAVATAVALGATLSGGAPNHNAPVATSTPSTSPPTTTPTHTPSTTPGSTGLTSAPGGGVSASSTPPTTTPAAPNPATYVAGAWLTAGQEPYGGQIVWHQTYGLYGTRVGRAVFYLPKTTSGIAEMSMDMKGACSSQGFAPSLAGVQYQMFAGPINGDENSDNLTKTAVAEEAVQGIYFYPSGTAAEAAWSQISSEWRSCAAQQTATKTNGSPQLVGSVERTLDQPDAQCWSDLGIVPSVGPDSGLLYHVCYVVHGDLIEWVGLTVEPVDSFSSVDVGSTDDTTLANMSQSMAAYGN